MPTVIAQSEYPDIVQMTLAFGEVEENIALRWDLIMSNHDTFQVRLHLNDQDIPWTHNLNITWVMQTWLAGRRWGTFTIQGEEFDPTLYIPKMEDLHFMLRVWVHNNLDLCVECDEIENWCQEEHVECVSCDETRPERGSDTLELQASWPTETEWFYLCARCQDDGHEFLDSISYLECDDECGTVALRNSGFITHYDVVGSRSGYWLCEGCTENYRWCDPCGRMVYEDEAYYNDSDLEARCSECWEDEDNFDGLVNEWNYRPSLNFHPKIPVDPLRPLYIGVELEMVWGGDECREWLERVDNEHGDLLYAKEDSSVEGGFEVVTHPMSPEWALENFPFDLFQDAIDAGAYAKHYSAGTHIHIDKSALTTAQMWKFMQIHHRLSEFCGLVGGRGVDSTYASFSRDKEVLQANAFKIAKDKDQAFGGVDRYVAVNLQNEQTMELRYMEGSIEPLDIKKNIQWVQAMYDFTDKITVHDIKIGVINTPNYLLHHIMSGDYDALLDHINESMAVPMALPGRSN